MPVVQPQVLASLQAKSEDVRNICILAHVDHGKTTLSDFLLATNGIVSPSQAGQARFLDNRADERERGITMKSSAISLYFSMVKSNRGDLDPERKAYLINLIDSPGHIDFSSEVSTASRLCDGAIVLVDVVEGVCSQTVTVLRQTWVEKLKPILVINKMDRLITELQLTPTEAFSHLTRLVEQVNAVLGSFFQGERMEEDLNWREKMEERVAATAARDRGDDSDPSFLEKDDEDIYFAPEKENVIFCSAIDGWAFTVRQFAGIYEKKLGMSRKVLEKVLWGNFYLEPKTKRVIGPKHLRGRSLKPIFVQLVLGQVWAVYQATTGMGPEKGNADLLEKITKSLNINLAPSISRSVDPVKKLKAVFAQWLPLSTALLVSVVENIPSPKVAQPGRLPSLLDGSPGSSHIDPRVRTAMVDFKATKEDPVVVYVSKMVSVPVDSLPENRRTVQVDRESLGDREMLIERSRKLREERARLEAAELSSVLTSSVAGVKLDNTRQQEEEEEEDDLGEAKKTKPEALIGFARIYSGVLSVGDEVYVLHPKFNPAHPHENPEPKKVKITALYMLMGGELERLHSVPAGVVFGVGGLGGHMLKAGTLCSQLEGSVNLAGVSTSGQPIFRVSMVPKSPLDLDKMVDGLKLLVQSDPCAEYEHLATGEHVLATAGELHLERCLLDLRERFARCAIEAGEPIVPYRETIVAAQDMRPPGNKDLGRGVVVTSTGLGAVTIRLRVRPLFSDVTELLVKNAGSVRRLWIEGQAKDIGSMATSEKGDDDGDLEGALAPDELKKQLQERFEKSKSKDAWRGAVDDVVSFGPKRSGPNILIDATRGKIFPKAFFTLCEDEGAAAKSGTNSGMQASDFFDKIIYAFQLAMQSGPLCNEPVQGVGVFIDDVMVNNFGGEKQVPDHGRLTSEVITSVQQGIREGFLDWSPRMMLAMYSVEIQASTEVIGRAYDVLTRRRGRVLSGSMKEGTPFFTIQALLPVAESFGFSTEMRKRTSGAAQPQLVFSGFDILDEDPFWVPFTEDDLEDLGESADKDNVAKSHMDMVRRRKGLLVEGRKRNAEKQKTLKR